MTPNPEQSKRIDLTRLNRDERRRLAKINGLGKIPGRNLPYVKKVHETYENYMKIRAEEIAKDEHGN